MGVVVVVGDQPRPLLWPMVRGQHADSISDYNAVASIAQRSERIWLCRASGVVLVALAGSIVGLRCSVRAWDTTLHPGATMCLLEDGAEAQCGWWVQETKEVRPQYRPATVPDPGDSAHLARALPCLRARRRASCRANT